MPQQRQKTVEEYVGERLTHSDSGHHSIGEQPRLVVTMSTKRLPRQKQRNRACSLGHARLQPQPPG